MSANNQRFINANPETVVSEDRELQEYLMGRVSSGADMDSLLAAVGSVAGKYIECFASPWFTKERLYAALILTIADAASFPPAFKDFLEVAVKEQNFGVNP